MHKFRITGMDNNFTRLGWQGQDIKKSIDTIFDGWLFKYKSPTQYLSEKDKKTYNGVEEMIVFCRYWSEILENPINIILVLIVMFQTPDFPKRC